MAEKISKSRKEPVEEPGSKRRRSTAQESRAAEPKQSPEARGASQRKLRARGARPRKSETERDYALRRILHLDETLKIIRNVNQLIVATDNEPELLHKACQQLVRGRNFKLAWIGLVKKGSCDVLPVAQCGLPDGYLSSLKVTWDDSDYGSGPTGTTIKTGKPCVMSDIPGNPAFKPWRKQALEIGCLSAAALPLIIDGEVIGALSLYSAEPDAFDEEEVNLLTELAGDISLGIQKIRQREAMRIAEEKLRQSEEKFRSLITNLKLGISRSTPEPDGCYVEVNPAMSEITGYSREELLKMKVADLYVNPEDRKAVLEKVKSAPAGTKTELHLRKKDGSLITVEGTPFPARDSQGKVIYYDGIIEDITERKKTAERILYLNETLKVIRNINQLIVQIDNETELLQKACQALITGRNYKLAWAGLVQEGSYEVKIAAQAGATTADYPPSIKLTWDDSRYGWGPIGTAIKTGKLSIVRDIAKECFFCPWQKQALKAGCQSAVALPLKIEKKVIGTLHIYSSRPDVFNEAELSFLTELAFDVSLGIQKIRQAEEKKRSQEALRQSEAKYSNIVERSNDAIVIAQDGVFKFVNSKMTAMTGFSREEFIGQSFLEFVAPEFRAIIAENYRKRMAGEKAPDNYEAALLGKDGRIIPVEISASRIEYENKPADTGILRDMTERKQAEEAIRLSEEKFNKAFHLGPEAMSIIELESGRIIDVNENYARLTGYKLEEIIGHTVFELGIYKRFEERTATIKTLKEKERYHDFEMTILTKSGEERTCLVSAELLRFGQQDLALGVYKDITERKQAEEALREAEERYRALIELGARSGEAVVMLEDTDKGIGMHIFISDAWLQMTGYSREELLNMSMPDLIHPRYREEAIARHRRRMRGEVLKRLYEIAIVRKDGTEFPVEVTYAPSTYHGRRVNVGFIRDITERKKAEEEVRKFKTIADSSVSGVSISSLDGTIVYVNETHARSHGYTSDELIGKNYSFLYPEEQLAFLAARRERILETGNSIDELWHRRKDGTLFPTFSVGTLVKDDNGKPLCIAATHFDLTERKKAEESLRETNEYLENLFNYANAPIIVWDTQFRITRFNHAFESLTARSSEDVIGKSLEILFPPARVNDSMELIKKTLTGERWETVEIPILHRDGSVRTVLWNSATILAPDGKTPVATIAQGQDITERKQAEEGLLKFKTITDQAGYGATVTSVEGIFSYVNEAFARMHGYTPEELVGEHYSILYTEEQLEAVKQIRDASIKEGRYFAEEIWRKKKDGTMFPTFNTNVIIKDDTGKPLYLSAVVTDITERKQAEEALRQSEGKFRGLIENLKVGVFRITPDPGGKFLEVNPAMSQITGYSREELFQLNVADLYAQPEDRKAFLKQASVKDTVASEVRLRKKDGTEIVVARLVTPVKGNSGKILYFDGIIEDITERKNMEQQLMAQDRLASLGQLVSGIAHELNNPLTGVIGFSDMLLKRDLPDDVKEDLKVINDEAMRTARIVKNLLTFARKQPEGKTAVDIHENIRGVLNLRDHEQMVNNIRVITHFASDLPQVMGNSSQLQQVFFNIVINAEFFMLEAHQKGNLTITTERIEDFVRASFADDGPGISNENMKHLFIPFFTTKEVGKGTGLGLSICHGIITEHGGRIYAESEPGKGATFVVELPVSKQ